jgi:hypothetical protein
MESTSSIESRSDCIHTRLNATREQGHVEQETSDYGRERRKAPMPQCSLPALLLSQ